MERLRKVFMIGFEFRRAEEKLGGAGVSNGWKKNEVDRK